MKQTIVILCIVSLLALLIGFDFIIQHYPYGHFILYSGVAGFLLAIVLASKDKK